MQNNVGHSESERSILRLQLRFPGGSVGKESACSVGDLAYISGPGEIPLEMKMAAHCRIRALRIPRADEPAGLHGTFSPWGGKVLDTTEQLNNNRHTFRTETLKILEIDEKILSLNKAKQEA